MVICIAAWRPILVPYSYEYVKMVASHVSNDTKRRLNNELLSLKAEWKFYEMERKFGQKWCHESEDRPRKNVSWLTVMVNDDFVVSALVRCEQWFLQAGRYTSMGKKPLRATVCFSIKHARPRDDYEYPTTRQQRELQQNNRFNNQNNNFARASRFYFCIFFAIFARLRREDA